MKTPRRGIAERLHLAADNDTKTSFQPSSTRRCNAYDIRGEISGIAGAR